MRGAFQKIHCRIANRNMTVRTEVSTDTHSHGHVFSVLAFETLQRGERKKSVRVCVIRSFHEGWSVLRANLPPSSHSPTGCRCLVQFLVVTAFFSCRMTLCLYHTCRGPWWRQRGFISACTVCRGSSPFE